MRWLSILFIFATTGVLAQNLDSMLTVLETKGQDTSRVNLLNHIAEVAIKTDPAQAREYCFEAIELSKELSYRKGEGDGHRISATTYYYQSDIVKAREEGLIAMSIYEALPDCEESLALTINNYGVTYYATGSYDTAAMYFQQHLELQLEMGNTDAAAKGYLNMGVIFKKQGDLPKAQEYYLKAIEMTEVGGSLVVYATALANMGNIFQAMGNDSLALYYYRQSIPARISMNDMKGLAQIYNNMGATFDVMGLLDSALHYQEMGLEIRMQIGNQDGIASSYTNIASIYSKTGRLDEARELFLKSIEIKEAIGDRPGLVYSYTGLGGVYHEEGNHIKAAYYMQMGIDLMMEVGADIDALKNFLSLAESYKETGNYEKALWAMEQYVLLNDSMLGIQNQTIINELQTRYETEQKEREISELKEKELEDQLAHEREMSESERQAKWLILGLALVSVLGGLIMIRYINNRKTNKILAAQNAEITEQKVIIEEKNKDITDSIHYASRIQQAILTSPDYLEKVLPEHFVLYQPRDIVSGDFYWVYENDSNEVVIAIADCTGHGVPGAFMSMIGNALLNEIVIENGTKNPASILDKLNEGIIKSLHQTKGEAATRDGMDIALCVFDKNNKTIAFSGANNPVWIINTQQELTEIKGDKQPIGYQSGEVTPFTTKQHQLNQGDVFYMFTDGYADQFGGPRGKKFKYKQLKEKLLEIYSSPTSRQHKELTHAFTNWKGDLEQIDDVCVIGIRV